MPPKPASPDWEAIRRRYVETDAAKQAIIRDAGITPLEFESARRHGNWRRLKPRGAFPQLRARTAASTTVETNAAPLEAARPTDGKPPAAVIPAQSGTRKRRRERGDPASSLDRAPVVYATPLMQSARRRRRRSTKDNLSIKAQRARLRRTVALIDLKLEQLEERMSTKRTAGEPDISATDHEREARAIGVLIENLDKAKDVNIAIDRAGGAADTADLAREAEQHRRELSGRLQKLVDAARVETK